MGFKPQHHDVCVNTAILDKYLDKCSFREEAFDYVYNRIVDMFKEQLEVAECQEDIYSDLYFETSYMIDRDSFDADAHEVIAQIFKDYDIKEAM